MYLKNSQIYEQQCSDGTAIFHLHSQLFNTNPNHAPHNRAYSHAGDEQTSRNLQARKMPRQSHLLFIQINVDCSQK